MASGGSSGTSSAVPRTEVEAVVVKGEHSGCWCNAVGDGVWFGKISEISKNAVESALLG